MDGYLYCTGSKGNTAMSETITSGMVLCAGLGTRMRPLTLKTPKPLIPVAGKTMADYAVDRLIEAGVDQVVLNVSYLGDQIKDHFGKRGDVTIDFSEEHEPLETGGGVFNALDKLKGEAFIVMNGDAILIDGPTPALSRMLRKWHKNDLDVLMLLQSTAKATGYDGRGDFFLTAEGIPSFRDEQLTAPYVFTGIQILSRRGFEERASGKWSLRDLYIEAIEKGRAMAILHDSDWLHVGTVEGLELAENYFAQED